MDAWSRIVQSRRVDTLRRQLTIAMSRRDVVAAIVIAQRIASL